MAHLPKGQGVVPMPPFLGWLANNIPAVYDNTMSYYEELVSLIKYLQDTVIPALNANSEAITVISNAVEQLQKYVEDYFKNLDVQEEINNKLDEMAEDGTLQEIITAYIQANVAWTFDTVADMKEATNLIDGSYAKVIGFFAVNDGGGATYRISDTQPAGFYVTLDSGLYAELVLENEMNLTQFGVDHTASDTTEDINRAIEICANAGITLIIPAHTYNLATITTNQSGGFTYNYFIEIISNMCIKGADRDKSILKIPNGTLNYTSIFLNKEDNHKNIRLDNFTVEQYYESGSNMSPSDRSNRKNVFTIFGIASDIDINNINFKNCCGMDPIAFHNENCTNIRVANCIFDYHYVRSISYYDRSIIYMECNNYVVENNIVKGNFETIGGIELHGYNGICRDNKISQCKFAIYVAPRHVDTIESNIHILSNIIIDSPNGIQLWNNSYSQNTRGTRGIIIANNSIKMQGSVLAQQYWGGSGMAKADQVCGISINPNPTGPTFENIHIDNNSIIINDYSNYKTAITSTHSTIAGILFFGRSSLKNVTITNNVIEGNPSSGIAIGDVRSSIGETDSYSVFSDIIIKNNIIKNCGYGSTSTSLYKAFLRIGNGIYKNVFIKNNILNKTDNSYATPNAIYNQTNADSSKSNLYCVENILTSVLDNEFTINAYNAYNIIIDKGSNTQRPTIANAGDTYYDTSLNKMIMYNGTAWVNVDGTAL